MKTTIELGAWIVAAHNVLTKWSIDDVALEPFDAIVDAGRAGSLFSATRALGKIDAQKFEIHRKLSKLKRLTAKLILREAEILDFIDIEWGKNSKELVQSFEFKNNSKEGVLEAVGKIFETLEPSAVAKATLELLAATVIIPSTIFDIKTLLSKKGFLEKDIELAIFSSTNLGLVAQTQEREGGEPLLFNPYAFEKDPTEIYQTLTKLTSLEQERALEILDWVKTKPGIPLPPTMDAKMLPLLVKAGLVDYSKITTLKDAKGVFFPTAPNVWGVFTKSAGVDLSKDLVDDAKVLLNSFRYGQFFSTPSRGKIKDPEWIVNKLVSERAIGITTPATAIGEDYPLALARGIVNIVESRLHPGRYSMELLKVDVAESVQEVIKQNTFLPTEHIPSAEEVDRAGQLFVSPSAVRKETVLPQSMKQCHDELVFQLRTMRKRS